MQGSYTYCQFSLAAAMVATLGWLAAQENSGETTVAGLAGKITRADGVTTVEYDFRHTSQTIDFENGQAGATHIHKLGSGSGSKVIEEYQDTGRLTFDPAVEVRWKAPAEEIQSVEM